MIETQADFVSIKNPICFHLKVHDLRCHGSFTHNNHTGQLISLSYLHAIFPWFS
jgi:hypothetical protein